MITCIGPIKTGNGTNFVGRLLFRPTTGPVKVDGEVIVPREISLDTEQDGDFETVLSPGPWRLFLGAGSDAGEPLLLIVPDGDTEKTVAQLTQLMEVGGEAEGGGGSGPVGQFFVQNMAALGAIASASTNVYAKVRDDGDGFPREFWWDNDTATPDVEPDDFDGTGGWMRGT